MIIFDDSVNDFFLWGNEDSKFGDLTVEYYDADKDFAYVNFTICDETKPIRIIQLLIVLLL